MRQMRTRVWALGLVLLMLPLGVASGQTGLPTENHYQVYQTTTPMYSVLRPVRLVDQFGVLNVTEFVLEKFANPTTKIHAGVVYQMVDPVAHQTWWRLMDAPPQPTRDIIAYDQFGYTPLKLGNAVYLLNPALKNVPPPAQLPLRNHYVCYEVLPGAAAPLMQPVILTDQFGTSNVVVVQSKYFCNPADKYDADGRVYPMVDPVAHLNCYRIDNPIWEYRLIEILDQFGYWPTRVWLNDCLCVPALKEHTVGSRPSTWGQIKALYR